MRNLIQFVILASTLGLSPLAQAELVTKQIDYQDGDTVLSGYLVFDNKITGKRPGVLVVHEWWGHNAYPQKRARQLAEQGYTAFALDMYGKGIQAQHPQDAMKFSGQFSNNAPLAISRFNAAMKVLKSQATVDTTKIAAIGYCFGGRIVLEMARSGADLRGVASVHGALLTQNPAKKGVVKAKVFVAHGAKDQMVLMAHLDAIQKEMKEAGVDATIKVYEKAGHGFSNPEADVNASKYKIPVAYDANADKDSWKAMTEFLASAFK